MYPFASLRSLRYITSGNSILGEKQKKIIHFYFDKVQCPKKSGIPYSTFEGHLQKDIDKLMFFFSNLHTLQHFWEVEFHFCNTLQHFWGVDFQNLHTLQHFRHLDLPLVAQKNTNLTTRNQGSTMHRILSFFDQKSVVFQISLLQSSLCTCEPSSCVFCGWFSWIWGERLGRGFPSL